jgi:GntR family transcriptional repressor for pyruvate dehydrogenase complex
LEEIAMARPHHIPLRSTLADALTHGILALMRDEQLQAGDRLPSVRELSDRFGVAVPTLREAIRRLEAFGVIEVRHGSGIFVRSAHPPLMMANPHANAIDSQVILDLLDARILFEPWCAEVAARHPESPGVAALAEILARAEAAIDTDDVALQAANMAFHRGVATCAGNVVVAQVMTLLTEIYSSEQSVMLTISNQRRHDHEEHRAIFAAIEAGNPPLAGERMRRHLESVRTTVAARLPGALVASGGMATSIEEAVSPQTSKEVPAIDR